VNAKSGNGRGPSFLVVDRSVSKELLPTLSPCRVQKKVTEKAPEKKKRIYLPDELESPELESTSEKARGADDPVRGEGDRSATENEQSKTD